VSSEQPVAAGRRRGRSRVEGARSRLPEQRPFAQPRMIYRPTEVVSADELEAIHVASLRILAEIGMDFLDHESRDLLAAAGAHVEAGSERVRFDPEMVTELIATCPETFQLHASNPAHTITVGGDHVAFGSVGSPPNMVDADGVRRPGDRAAFRDLLRLCQAFNVVHFVGGYPVEPIDLHPSVRHIEAALDVLTLTDKVPHTYSLGRQRNRDVLELVRIARQVDEATLQREPSVFSVINSSSPLRLDLPMLQGIIELSSRNQVIVMTPFTLSGAMAPVTLAGAVAQQNAEALAGMVFTQVVRPGSPVVYGGFTSNVDMQSGAPAFGTPEYVRTAMLGGQLARRYRVPYRSSNVCAANTLDAQAAYESVFSLWGAVMGGVNFLMHGAGWMEGGLHASLAKFVLDADLLAMVAAILDPVVVDDDALAFDAIAEVGPGGHFFGAGHTQQRYRDAFHRPLVSDWRNYESWVEAGRPEAAGRAAELARRFLAEYEPPAMDPAVRDQLEDYVARRRAEGGVATDY
jgi:trimethylamine--corrinoid protein Co-methyltransferase